MEYELTQRKKLSELCHTLEDEKKKLASEIIERKKRLEGLGPRLNAVLEATKPLQEHLGLPIDKVLAEHKLASLLPDPLYLFYVNVDAYKQVYTGKSNIRFAQECGTHLMFNFSYIPLSCINFRRISLTLYLSICFILTIFTYITMAKPSSRKFFVVYAVQPVVICFTSVRYSNVFF